MNRDFVSLKGWIGASVVLVLASASCAGLGEESAAYDGDAGAEAAPSGTGGGGGMEALDSGPDTYLEDATTEGWSATPTTFFIHASHDLFPVRICLEADGEFLNKYPYPHDITNPIPQTSFPGIPRGGMANLDELFEDIDMNQQVRLYLINANNADVAEAIPESPTSCDTLVNPTAPTLSDDEFAVFEDVNLNDLTAFTVRSFVVEGCRDANAFTPTQCGSGDLHFRSMGFSPTHQMEPPTVSVYPMHISPSLSEYAEDLQLSHDLSNGTTRILAHSLDGEPPEAAAHVEPPGSMEASIVEALQLTRIDKDNGAELEVLKASFANVQRVSSPYELPTDFFTGASAFLLVFVGDATPASPPWLAGDGTWNPEYDGQGLHLLALPFHFEMNAF